MLYANDLISNFKIPARKNAIGFCPYCNAQMIPKCGAVKIHHWAHKQKECSDTWYEPETQWHLNWKSHFPMEDTEVLIKNKDAIHIADYFNKTKNYVIEFQNSSLSLFDKIERETFYPNLIWVINVKNKSGFEFEFEKIIQNNLVKTFRWKHPIQWVVKEFRHDIIYLIDNFPGDGKLFKIINIEHDEGYDFVSVGYNEYYTHYHKVYISGIVYTKSFVIPGSVQIFFDTLNDTIAQRRLTI